MNTTSTLDTENDIQQQDPDSCYHCHDPFFETPIKYDNHAFCCQGCKNVYMLLSQHDLGAYYQQGEKIGVQPTKETVHFDQLDAPEVRKKLIQFQEGSIVRVQLHLPQIHCASCIYLLEHLHKLDPGIRASFVNFPKRLATITFDESQTSLKAVATLLTKIGYRPDFSSDKAKTPSVDKRLLIQLGFAGFAFGSIMLWSFPEYLGIDETYAGFRNLSAYLALIVSIPVLFISARDYFVAAWGGIRTRRINLDIPIAIGIVALYVRSVVAIFNHEGPGYMDSFAGFIFFLLIGKWFQSKTYRWLSFERDFKSYFPIAVLKKTHPAAEKFDMTPIEDLQVGDQILIRHEEIIPSDALLISETATIDYSFVTGEADWIEKKAGDFIYAGGRVMGNGVEMCVERTTNRSELTQLWNEQERDTNTSEFTIRQDRISGYFLWTVLVIAALSSIGWWFIEPKLIPEIVTAILIVACPCALALSGPFTYGNMMRKMGNNGFYLRNTTVIEKMQTCSVVVFDKTGTLTSTDQVSCQYEGQKLTTEQIALIAGMTAHATHPYAQQINRWANDHNELSPMNIPLQEVQELSGKGMQFQAVKIGSASWLGIPEQGNESASFLALEGKILGKFTMGNEIRFGIEKSIKDLAEHYELVILSGDNDHDKEKLERIFPANTTYLFQQKPIDKKRYIESLREGGKNVIMIGDGLNDAGALQAATIGIAVSEDLVRFTPASDAILKADNLQKLNAFLKYVRDGRNFLKISFAFSLAYNITGLTFAISGSMTPFVAAVIMPVSSITVVGLSTFLALRRKF
ncbi:MAG: heavy metal translocating P-type ATPase [Fluviicola sp.]